jgi:cobyrinic acid a,c-diamide synthase
MYLGERLRTADGATHPMAGALPLAVWTEPRLVALGYVEAEIVLGDGAPLRARGHEFHHSVLEAPAPSVLATAYTLHDARGGRTWREGYRARNVLASWVHLHFGSCPALAARLLGEAVR